MAHVARCPLKHRTPAVRHTASRPAVRVAAFGKFLKTFFSFNDDNWGPKSTRIWRQQQYEYPGGTQDDASGAQGEAQASSSQGSAREQAGPAVPPQPSGDDLAGQLQASISGSPRPSLDGAGGDDDPPGLSPQQSFLEAGDNELSAALNKRIGQIAISTASYDSTVTEEEMRQPLSAQALRELIYGKYGKTYDVSFVRRDIPGKTFICLNIMWNHLEQRSFKLTEAQYMEKLDGIAYIVGALGQTDKVRAFLKEPPRSQNGMPPRPVVGTAITIRFDLEQSVVDEWFGNGYQ